MELDLEDWCSTTCVEESIRIVRDPGRAQQIEVVAEIGRDITHRGDRGALKQIMLNLLSNAVKFTPAGGRSRSARRDRRRRHLLGRGHRHRHPARGAGKARPAVRAGANQFTKSHRGSGLGLAITALAGRAPRRRDAHRSREGDGTTVTVFFPSRPASASAADAA